MTRSRVRTPAHLLLHSLDNRRMAMPQQNRSMPGPVVDKLVAIHIPLVCACGSIHIHRKRFQMTQVMRHAVGKQLLAPLVELA